MTVSSVNSLPVISRAENLIQAKQCGTNNIGGKSANVRTSNAESMTRKGRQETNEEFLVKYRQGVYDLRNFPVYHPGGRKALANFRNRSVDKAFTENPHSKSAYHLFQDFSLTSAHMAQEELETKDYLEDAVDWDAPLLFQVGGLAGQYWEWVNLPLNRPIRLFRSDFLEYMTITPWYFVPFVWFPVLLFFLHTGFSNAAFTCTVAYLTKIVLSYGTGIWIWTILEYTLHRKLFHFKPPENSRVLITLHFLLHGVHHKAPFDGQRLLFPPVAGLLVAKLFWEVYKAMFPLAMVNFIAAGTTSGYLCYDLMHYYLHHGAPKVGSYLYNMKRSHNYHHFLHHDRGFGISSRLWDRAFGTDVTLRQLSKPIEW